MGTDLRIVAGLPYSRRIRVVGAAATWPTVEDFEVRSQVRTGRGPTSTLLFALADYLTPSVEGGDIILDLHMTGSQTRQIKAGFYDIVISDPGEVDERAIRALHGSISIGSLTTAPVDV